MFITLFLISIVGGTLSGLISVSAVVLIPLLLAVPPLVGAGTLTMGQVTGLTMIQVLAGAVSGGIAHRKQGHMHMKTVLFIGIPMGICAMLGAYYSKVMTDLQMKVIFGLLVFMALGLMLAKRRQVPVVLEAELLPAVPEEEDESFTFNGPLSVTIGGSIGLVSGILGMGGGFILIPLMLRVLKIPMRTTVGSCLGIVLIGAVSGSLGKILALQVEVKYLLPVLLGSIPAAQLGAHLSKKIPSRYLQYLLIGVILLALVRTWYDILFGVHG